MKRIDLYTSPTCHPCKVLKPVLEEFATEEGVDVNTIDLANNRVAFEEYNVKSTPTMIFFNNGTEYKRFSGSATKAKLKELFEVM